MSVDQKEEFEATELEYKRSESAVWRDLWGGLSMNEVKMKLHRATITLRCGNW